MAELANAGQADLPAEVPADHPEAGRPAIHLVDLLDVLDLPDAALAFPEEPVLIGEWIRPVPSAAAPSGRVIDCHFVVHAGLGRQRFGREIERHARFGLGLILRQPFLQQLAEFREILLQVAAPPSGSSASSWQSLNASTEAARGEPFRIESSPKKSPSR